MSPLSCQTPLSYGCPPGVSINADPQLSMYCNQNQCSCPALPPAKPTGKKRMGALPRARYTQNFKCSKYPDQNPYFSSTLLPSQHNLCTTNFRWLREVPTIRRESIHIIHTPTRPIPNRHAIFLLIHTNSLRKAAQSMTRPRVTVMQRLDDIASVLVQARLGYRVGGIVPVHVAPAPGGDGVFSRESQSTAVVGAGDIVVFLDLRGL